MSLDERHYTPKELGTKIGISPSTIIRWIEDDPDVLRQHNPGSQRTRKYTTYSIPEHVAQRIYSHHLKKNARKVLPGADRRKVDFVVRHERRKRTMRTWKDG